MPPPQFSLAWNNYRKNICNGLSSLQQNEEFVDMTLAADGHLVKVHQIVMALSSPFIKELITSANCPHPIIFLNKISYSTLCSLLEYIYTGEVLVPVENINEFIQAGRELHIKGLEDMKYNLSAGKSLCESTTYSTFDNLTQERVNPATEALDDAVYLEEEHPDDYTVYDSTLNQSKIVLENISYSEDVFDDANSYIIETKQPEIEDENRTAENSNIDHNKPRVMQYTVSNQGSLQMILNRYLYYLKHTNKNSSRQWRCVDYVNSLKCPAHVVTRGDMVVQRIAAHTHPFHDKKILKKVNAGAIFSAIHEAERERTCKRKQIENSKDKQIETE